MAEKEKATLENATYTVEDIHSITKLEASQIKYLIRIGLTDSELVGRQVGLGSNSRTISVRIFNYLGLEAFIKAELLNGFYSPLCIVDLLKSENPTMNEVIEITKRKRNETSILGLYDDSLTNSL